MRQDLNEIQKVLDKHGYTINTIICDVMKKFKFKTLCWKVCDYNYREKNSVSPISPSITGPADPFD